MSNGLSSTQAEGIREILLGPRADAFLDLMFELHLSQPLSSTSRSLLADTSAIGLIDDHGALTSTGWAVADVVREYRFWLARDRKLHSEDEVAFLAPSFYADKSVLETGSGFGCNLFSLLRRVRGRFVGVEPVTVYRQLTPILAEREGLEPPEIVDATAESLPFADAEFDVVLCYSAHQYMSIKDALDEMARVLRPGGQIQIIGSTFSSFLTTYGKRLISCPSLGAIKTYLLTIGNTLSYQCASRRLFVPRGWAATSAPVFPYFHSMRRWLIDAGFEPRDEVIRRVGVDTCFIADKPA